jgi:CRP-like cAMP-binding protein
LTDEEEEVRALVFAGLATGDVLRVLSIGSWATAESGQRLIQRDKPVESISLIVRGRVRVTKDKQVLGELGAGQIVGSALLLSGATAEVDAVAVEPSRTVQWNVGTLERYLNAHPETRNVLQRHLARDLAGKLQTMADGVSNNTTSTGMS